MNKEEFRNITELLEENFNKKIDLRILDMWYETFKQYPKHYYENLVNEVIKQETYMPSLATMRAYIKPKWFDRKITKRTPTREELAEIENILKEYE